MMIPPRTRLARRLYMSRQEEEEEEEARRPLACPTPLVKLLLCCSFPCREGIIDGLERVGW